MAKTYDQEQKQISLESLQTALFLLMKEQPFSDITITALCKKAGISRMAFYRNYDSKKEVITDYFRNQIQPLYQLLSALPVMEATTVTRTFFQYVDAHTELFEVLIGSGAEELLVQEFMRLVSQFYLDNVKTIPFEGEYAFYWNSYVSAGLYHMTIQWIKNGKQTSIELLTQIAVKIGG